jgi:hypothetical protein
MTVSTQTSQVTYFGNGSTTSWTFPFIGVAASDIEVSYTDLTGFTTILGPSQYTLTLNPKAVGSLWGIGGTVIYPISGSAITTGTSLTIRRTVPFQQTISISNQGAFYPQAIEQALDLLELQLQQISNRTGQYRGTWITNTFYNYGDIVIDGINGAYTNNYYMCTVPNTSGTWSTDLSDGYWTIFIDVQSFVIKGPRYALAAKTANYTATVNDVYLDVDASAGAITITVPPNLSTPTDTQPIIISKVDTTANIIQISDGTNVIDVIVTPATANGQIGGYREVTGNGSKLRSKGVG